MNSKAGSVLIAILIFLLGCNSDDPIEPMIGTYRLVDAFPDLAFNRPVDFQNAKDNRNFVVEQFGVISVFANEASALTKKTFLDISDRVDDADNEEGLLGLAFHPNYQNNGFFYVNYTAANPSRTVISRFKVSADPDVADKSSEFIILEFSQPFGNHNGGQIAFGPDSYLYIATGDGGSGGDPQGNAQNLESLLGKILRIDVNNTAGANNYSIPGDNPFVGGSSGERGEIFAYGLRNPWRFSFDAEQGYLLAGDVGQNAYEEIDLIEKGGNYGWNELEGNHCYQPPTGCDLTGTYDSPVWEYDRSQGFSVTGGYVYRGTKFPEFKGLYIFGDFGSGKIWALDLWHEDGPTATELISGGRNISSFGVDQNQELYVCGFNGKIYKLEAM